MSRNIAPTFPGADKFHVFVLRNRREESPIIDGRDRELEKIAKDNFAFLKIADFFF